MPPPIIWDSCGRSEVPAEQKSESSFLNQCAAPRLLKRRDSATLALTSRKMSSHSIVAPAPTHCHHTRIPSKSRLSPSDKRTNKHEVRRPNTAEAPSRDGKVQRPKTATYGGQDTAAKNTISCECVTRFHRGRRFIHQSNGRAREMADCLRRESKCIWKNDQIGGHADPNPNPNVAISILCPV